MLVFRSLALGLLGACFLLLATRPTEVRIERELVPVFRPAPSAATIIDIAHGVTPGQLAQLVRLQPDEHIIAIDDHPVTSDLDAGAMIASNEASAKQFVDLTINDGRRILLLFH
jgi:hypothetical protein